MIYTLDYLEQEAKGIQSAWNGEDDRFNYNGELLPQDYAGLAEELEEKLKEVRELVTALSL